MEAIRPLKASGRLRFRHNEHPLPQAHQGGAWMDRDELCAHLSISPLQLRALIQRGDVERQFVGSGARYRACLPPQELRRAIDPDGDEPPTYTFEEADNAQRLAIAQRNRLIGERDAALEKEAAEQALLRSAHERLAHLQVQRDKAIEANRALLHEHHQVAAQRDEALAVAERLVEERDDAMRHLARAVQLRGQTADQLQRVLAQRDKVMAQLDLAIEQRDDTLDRLDRALEQRAMALEGFESARKMLLEWNDWRQSAQKAIDDNETRAATARRLAREALDVPWWDFKRRRELRDALKNL